MNQTNTDVNQQNYRQIKNGQMLMEYFEKNYRIACLQLMAGDTDAAKTAVRAMYSNIEAFEEMVKEVSA